MKNTFWRQIERMSLIVLVAFLCLTYQSTASGEGCSNAQAAKRDLLKDRGYEETSALQKHSLLKQERRRLEYIYKREVMLKKYYCMNGIR